MSAFSADVLFQVLSFLTRSEFSKLAVTCKQLNHVTEKHFSTAPLYSIDHLYISHPSNSSQFDCCNYPNFNLLETSTFNCSLKTLQQYSNSNKCVIRFVTLYLNRAILSVECKQELESISNLWKGGKLVLWPLATKNDQEQRSLFQEVFGWSNIFTCSHLILYFCGESTEVGYKFHLRPLFYNFDVVDFVYLEHWFGVDELIEFLENSPRHRDQPLKISFCLYDWQKLNGLLSRTKEWFCLSKYPCSFQLEIRPFINLLYDTSKYFKLTNQVTREHLEFCLSAMEKHNHIYVLRRFFM
uniref:F-box domain-containing protein n=1 Tax=Ditylenchus dipsaci TaxID=166011 RepID=A0A915DB72_9BILA